jgi:hypothetical protein
MNAAFERGALSAALADFATAWLKRGQRCDWCGAPLKTIDDLAAFLEFCGELGKLWPPSRKGLPRRRGRVEGEVFCGACAGHAICELIDGVSAPSAMRRAG